MKKIILIIATFALLVSCGTKEKVEPKTDMMVQKQTEESMAEANRQVGMPGITEFQEKKIMKMIYELRDQSDLVCHAYLFNAFTGEVGQYLGKCIGYGLPYSTQFSNPEKYGQVNGGEYGAINPYTMPQPEPNGLFMPEGLSATWLLLIDPETNEPRPVYIEPAIIVSPFKLR